MAVALWWLHIESRRGAPHLSRQGQAGRLNSSVWFADITGEFSVHCTSPPGTVICAFSGSFGTRFFLGMVRLLQSASVPADIRS
jgi:hypothetical protein